jgi:hypothetical protein
LENKLVEEVVVATLELTDNPVTVVVVVAGSIENSEEEAGITIFPALSLRVM